MTGSRSGRGRRPWTGCRADRPCAGIRPSRGVLGEQLLDRVADLVLVEPQRGVVGLIAARDAALECAAQIRGFDGLVGERPPVDGRDRVRQIGAGRQLRAGRHVALVGDLLQPQDTGDAPAAVLLDLQGLLSDSGTAAIQAVVGWPRPSTSCRGTGPSRSRVGVRAGLRGEGATSSAKLNAESHADHDTAPSRTADRTRDGTSRRTVDARAPTVDWARLVAQQPPQR